MFKTTTILALLILFTGTVARAQSPVLTSSGNPTRGDEQIEYATDTFAIGLGGAGLVWHYDTLAAYGVDTVFVDNCPASPYCSDFPGSNGYARTTIDAATTYFFSSDSVLSYTGAYNTVPVPYDNPEDLLRYPFTYNSSYTDTFSSTFTSAGYTYRRTGTITVRADAYGTLYLPYGTFTNVLRVRSFEIYDDSTTVSGAPYIWHYTSMGYSWYVPGMHMELLNLTRYTRNSMLASISTYFTRPFTSAVSEVRAAQASMQLYPNPATSQFTLHCDQQFGPDSWAGLYTVTGLLVGRYSLSGSNAAISVAALPAGMYQCRIHNTGHEVQVKKVVVQK